MPRSAAQTVAVARHAMATRFEIVLHGRDAVRLRAAAEEALDEIERLDAQLSLYRPTSEIAHLNRAAANGPVRVEPGLFRLLQRAKSLSGETGGAFDITVAPLMRCWGFMGGTGKLPGKRKLAAARVCVGMHLVELDAENFTVRFVRDGVMLDLGAIGKGYALERAAMLLREAGVKSALLHGGTSTVCAIGAPPGQRAWKVAIQDPEAELNQEGTKGGDVLNQECRKAGKEILLPSWLPNSPHPRVLVTVELKDEALSVSAVWGKAFAAKGKVYGHVLDPRTGAPVEGAVLAAVVLPSATETDALSTALLTVGIAGHKQVAALRQGMRTLVAGRGKKPGEFRLASQGITNAAGAGSGND